MAPVARDTECAEVAQRIVERAANLVPASMEVSRQILARNPRLSIQTRANSRSWATPEYLPCTLR
jgi:hypothetical protein